ncbi:MAG TPA: tRNA (N6-isopentenyl adenosine(37)-C2)-methylthiotransferase MiaB [Bacteroidales bacterium]|jgi:tRNA-2-methylthio-N6-dimethylallyladenosine synthase|nr:tRNA (N6-isopentenyl adenosine(37)-C2)-methylthiotransferase MiaB [Bacteroidales bacterium]
MSQKYLYIETYGCQMNFNDSEVVAAVLEQDGYTYTEEIKQASLILLNTCSIREHAENKVFQRLNVIKKMRKQNSKLLIGVIGCMAERLRDQLFDNDVLADIVAGPDSYRNLPELVRLASQSKHAIDVHLSESETYNDITPYRVGNNRISAFVSIMRGCNNFCTYCIVPYTRGRERSREVDSILNEVRDLEVHGYKEITLLGQNVNSYAYSNNGVLYDFPKLLELVATTVPHMRIRFTTSHPKDMSDEVLYVIANNNNIGKWIHLPVQSGSTSVLQRMNRKYTREWYLNRVDAIKRIVPEASITTDILCGFSGETDEEHADTLSIMKHVEFDMAYMFKYSERPGTTAAKMLPDTVSEEVKIARLNEIIALQNALSKKRNQADVGKIFDVLVEGRSKKTDDEYKGRNSQNKTIVFPRANTKIGDFVKVKVISASSATLKGEVVVE